MSTNLQTASPESIAAFRSAISDDGIGIGLLANRHCELSAYESIAVPSFDVAGELVAYASPESTYAVTRSFVQAARESILIGIYDFTAGYMKELLLQAMRRGVAVALMLDLDGRTGETDLFMELKQAGCDAVAAPSCASDNARFFPSAHEKVIVIDDTWTLVQSGNYSVNSIPANERDGGDMNAFVPGNRDTGLAVQSRPLARFLGDRLRADMQLARDAGGAPLSALALAEEIVILAAAPTAPAPRLFPSMRFIARTPVRITPVLSPDNYMAIVPDLLASATRSVAIEQQYIRGHQPAVGRLLAALRAAMDRVPDLDVRIVLGHPFDDDGAQEIRALGERFGLELGRHVRLINPAHFVHCHNKLIVVDEESVLVGSQNWSDFAVTRNREVSLLLRFPELARYYAAICDVDWTTGVATFPERRETVLFAPEALPAGNLVPLSVGDYALV